MDVWSWRQVVIQGAGLSSTTRHVLLTLSCYMNDLGEGCFPSIDTLSANTGLSCRAVIGALNMAELAGFIVKEKHGYAGQRWARNEYRASFPKRRLFYGIIPPTKVASDRQKTLARRKVANALASGKLVSQPCCVCGVEKSYAHHVDYAKALDVFWLCKDHHSRLHAMERNLAGADTDVVTLDHHDAGKVVTDVPQGGDRRSPKVVTDGHTNSPITPPKNSSSGGFSEDGKTSSSFRIDHLLTDMARVRARSAAPGWDIQLLMRVYDENVNSGKMPRPRSADAAFPKWCAAYTRGRPPS